MRLIDADKLKYEAELCRETTDAFKELIDRQPDYYKPEPVLISNKPLRFSSNTFGCPHCGAKWVSCNEIYIPETNFCPVCGKAVLCK